MDLPIRTDEETFVILGVDTHADAHVAVALDGLGRRLGHTTVPSTEAGYAMLLAWAEDFGALERVGVEGSGSFGLGLARFLGARGVEVVEVSRPNRQHRRRFGKHDTADAEAAARALQADTATGEPKSADGPAEMVRTLHVARRSALKARTQAANPNCAHCSSPRQKSSGHSCAVFPRPKNWSQPRRASVRAAFPKICRLRLSWR